MKCTELDCILNYFLTLNNNMRCFEIEARHTFETFLDKLNNNMRCFEINDLHLTDGSGLSVKQ